MERDNLANLGLDGRIILEKDQDLEWGGMDWIDLAEYRNNWQSLVNAVMNLRGFF
jgi:hypothetical protein